MDAIAAKIGFIGGGQMARALASGFVSQGLLTGSQVFVSDPVAAATEQFCQLVPGATAAADPNLLVAAVDIVFLAVKPQILPEVFHQLYEGDPMLAATSQKLFVSIAAGVTLATLAAGLRTERVIRVMPNTPCLVGAGASAYCVGPAATSQDGRTVQSLMAAVGTVVPLPEKHMDAVTGLSGSGPAFIYQVIEALSDGGVKAGLPRDVAQQLAAQTVFGAAKMVIETGQHPAVLKDQVTSPGGTTIAGLQALENGGLRATLMRAVTAATDRSQELGKQHG